MIACTAFGSINIRVFVAIPRPKSETGDFKYTFTNCVWSSMGENGFLTLNLIKMLPPTLQGVLTEQTLDIVIVFTDRIPY